VASIRRFLPVALCLVAVAQTPAFEAASVKPSTVQSPRGSIRGGPGTSDPGRLTCTNATLFDVILRAYGLKRFQLSGPDWLASARYDITATIPANASKEQAGLMLQRLLAERFHLAAHHETRQLQGFELVVGPRGTKLKPSSESSDTATSEAVPPKTDSEGYPILAGPGMAMMEGARAGSVIVFLTARAQPVSALADLISREFQMPILDRSGLKGNYDFRMAFAPRPPGAISSTPDDDAAANLIQAVQQQLGLRLNSAKIPTDVVVVDRAEKIPSGN
jgi:uncharacterized protein (TIGR03435 family)